MPPRKESDGDIGAWTDGQAPLPSPRATGRVSPDNTSIGARLSASRAAHVTPSGDVAAERFSMDDDLSPRRRPFAARLVLAAVVVAVLAAGGFFARMRFMPAAQIEPFNVANKAPEPQQLAATEAPTPAVEPAAVIEPAPRRAAPAPLAPPAVKVARRPSSASTPRSTAITESDQPTRKPRKASVPTAPAVPAPEPAVWTVERI